MNKKLLLVMEKEHLEFSGRHMATIRGLERATSAVGRRLSFLKVGGAMVSVDIRVFNPPLVFDLADN